MSRVPPSSTLTRVLRVLVHSNLIVSLATTSVAVTSIVLFGLSLEWLPLFICFGATQFVYTVNRFTDLAEDRTNVPHRAAFTERLGWPWLVGGATLYLGAVIVAFVLAVPGAVFVLLPAIVIGCYSVLGLKRVLLVKNLTVGAAWAGIPLGVGTYYGVLWTLEVWVLAGYVGAMITVAAIIFDLKDTRGDRAEGITTVPILVGPRRTRIGCQCGNLAVAGAIVGLVAVGIVDSQYLVVLVMNAYVGAYIPFADPDHGPLFYGFVVDGEHVVLAAAVLALEWLG